MIDKITAEEIANKYYKEIYTYCLSYANCSEAEAEDITQDVFLTFQLKLDNIQNINIRSWLIGTAKNKVREYFKDNQKSKMLVPLSPDEIPTDDIFLYIDNYLSESESFSEEDIVKCKELILKSLSKTEFEIYTKVFVEKKTHQQTADEMNMTKNAVSLRVSRLRRKIKKLVSLSLNVIGAIIIKTLFL